MPRYHLQLVESLRGLQIGGRETKRVGSHFRDTEELGSAFLGIAWNLR